MININNLASSQIAYKPDAPPANAQTEFNFDLQPNSDSDVDKPPSRALDGFRNLE